MNDVVDNEIKIFTRCYKIEQLRGQQSMVKFLYQSVKEIIYIYIYKHPIIFHLKLFQYASHQGQD